MTVSYCNQRIKSIKHLYKSSCHLVQSTSKTSSLPVSNMKNQILTFILLIAGVSAFQTCSPFARPTKAAVASVKPLFVILTDEETERILQTASDCAEGECSIDDVSELIAELKEQEKEMQSRLAKIMNMIAHLQHINAKEERKTDEVRAFVKDLLRTFSTDKPLYFPTGFAGDVGDGPTTAYDALPPKKWTAPKE